MTSEKSDSFTLKTHFVSHNVSAAPIGLNVVKSKLYMHTHECHEFLIVFSGDLCITVDNETIKAEPGDAFLIPRRTPHRVTFLSDAVYDRIIVDVPPTPKINGVIETVFKGKYFVHTENPSLISDLFSRYKYYSETLPQELFDKLSDGFYTELLCVCDSSAERLDKTARAQKLLSDCLLYINENLSSISNVDEIAKALFISKPYLYKLFQKYYSTTPKRFLEQKRLALADSYIAAGTPPTAAYELVGYIDYSTFYRAYKRFYGSTPSSQRGST